MQINLFWWPDLDLDLDSIKIPGSGRIWSCNSGYNITKWSRTNLYGKQELCGNVKALPKWENLEVKKRRKTVLASAFSPRSYPTKEDRKLLFIKILCQLSQMSCYLIRVFPFLLLRPLKHDIVFPLKKCISGHQILI